MEKAACKRAILHERVLPAYRELTPGTGAALPAHTRNSRVHSHCRPLAGFQKIDSTMTIRAVPFRFPSTEENDSE